MSKTVDKFLHRYSARLTTSPLKYYRSKPVFVDYEYNSTMPLSYDANIEVEPSIELTMSECDFSYLVEMHERLEELMYRPPDRYQGRGVEYMLEQLERETRLRNHYPQLKELYDQYQTMLRLLDDGLTRTSIK